MESQRICPNMHCQAPLVKQNNRGVTVDICPRDGMMVLDPGELEIIVSQISTMPGFQPIPPANYAAHRTAHASGHGHHGRRHHGSSGGIFDGVFGSS